MRQVHDRFHIVLHGLNETRAALRIFVLGFAALSLSGFAVVKPIAAAGAIAHPILMIQPDVEPDGRIKSPILIHAQPGQLIKKDLAVCLAEVTILDTPIGNGAANAVNELSNGGFPLSCALLAIKIF